MDWPQTICSDFHSAYTMTSWHPKVKPSQTLIFALQLVLCCSAEPSMPSELQGFNSSAASLSRHSKCKISLWQYNLKLFPFLWSSARHQPFPILSSSQLSLHCESPTSARSVCSSPNEHGLIFSTPSLGICLLLQVSQFALIGRSVPHKPLLTCMVAYVPHYRLQLVQ